MQNTRLNNLFDAIARRTQEVFVNPWRRLSLLVISFLSGFFLGTAVSTTAGQKAELDIVAAAFILIITETVSRIYYRRGNGTNSLGLEVLNTLKIGLMYSLFIEALKLGS
ncbi:DUF565 domain-containing protein [Calothrix sp. PCC 6303]|uniref:DUF565 domain-containing protein n=1 Tax=Calothrix sp. PCC 6303 TaxID=1170562 RepID=UPI0002A03C39|nr:DUF565 domain-containing protein [Calothrix sp. PCC 6303]AFZ00669.1 protein of unknown function DUF565 [Calothrix sp. PCC 6303]